MNINDLNTIEQLEQFLTGSQAVAFLVASSSTAINCSRKSVIIWLTNPCSVSTVMRLLRKCEKFQLLDTA